MLNPDRRCLLSCPLVIDGTKSDSSTVEKCDIVDPKHTLTKETLIQMLSTIHVNPINPECEELNRIPLNNEKSKTRCRRTKYDVTRILDATERRIERHRRTVEGRRATQHRGNAEQNTVKEYEREVQTLKESTSGDITQVLGYNIKLVRAWIGRIWSVVSEGPC